MDEKKLSGRELLFTTHGIPPMGASLSLAFQHLVAMIVGCVTPAIIVANAAGLDMSDRVILIQASLVVSAISTFLQIFPIGGKKGGFRFGSGLPVIIGISFAYVPSMQAIAGAGEGGHLGVANIAGAMLVGGAVAVIVGLFLKKIRKFFPPIITGTVVFTIGLSLYPTAINYMAGGTSNTYELVVQTKGLTEALVYGSWQNWVVALLTLAMVVLLSNYTKGITKLAATLFGMIFGYIVALCFGMVDFSGLSSSGWFEAPHLVPFGMNFDVAACIALGLLFAVNSVQAIGDFTSTTVGGMDREPTDNELQGGILCYGVTNMLGSFFGGLPTATYSQNVGIVSTNKVINRFVFAVAAGFMLLAGLIPKFSGLLTTIPQCVLGGATVSVFSTIAMTGMRLITSKGLSPRTVTVVGLSVALGVGVWQAADSIGQFPETFTMVFGKSPVVVATIVALILHNIIPKDKDSLAD